VLASHPNRVRAISGCEHAAAGLPAVRHAMLRSLLGEMHDRPLLSTTDALLAYLRLGLGALVTEVVHVLFLDARLHLIREEKMFHGSIAECPFYVREIVRRALELGSPTLIVVHNHPSGGLMPSADDCKRTRDLVEASRLFDIHVVDHLIISRSGCLSMRAMGHLS
jgi:DNA repair protein RadC